ncbi:VRR-NUC domain-containing protein [Corynebacterium casei]|uniref:VRR-NUC domain-containing protein n=1 Tax=Corynebacterium casei TaxID=160386 RepID=UPI003FD11099
MNEKQLETMFINAVKKAGGKAYKFVSPTTAGMPDRLVIFPGGKVGFIELKAPGQKVRPLQKHRLEELTGFGLYARALDSPHDIQEVIHGIQTA